jgi:SAM-dependent methyltransferase
VLQYLSHPCGLVLDAACGTAIDSYEINKLGFNVVSLDISKKRIGAGKEFFFKYIPTFKPNFVIADIQYLPFRASSFDAIISSETLEHVPDDRRTLTGFQHILKPSGAIVLTVPFGTKLSKADLKEGHLRRYTLTDLEKLSKYCGFKVQCCKLWGVPLPPPLMNLIKHIIVLFGLISFNILKHRNPFSRKNTLFRESNYDSYLVFFYTTRLYKKIILPFLTKFNTNKTGLICKLAPVS